jgi:hypothetical protein
MSIANPLWGAPRVHGELLKLGINIGQTSVAKYKVRRRHPPSQGWKTFIRNHADGIAAMDLFVVPTISFRLLYGLLIGSWRRSLRMVVRNASFGPNITAARTKRASPKAARTASSPSPRFRMYRDCEPLPMGRLDVNRMKSLLSVLDVNANRIYADYQGQTVCAPDPGALTRSEQEIRESADAERCAGRESRFRRTR